MMGETETSVQVLRKEQTTEMLKKLKGHNKELYMIIEAIVEG